MRVSSVWIAQIVVALACTIIKKEVSMIRKYQDLSLQIIPWHREEEPQNTRKKLERTLISINTA